MLVKPGASLLFLVSDVEDNPSVKNRQALHRLPDGSWQAGAGSSATSCTTAELLTILDSAPERLSPNALLRAVFQDTILPTTAYVGGPAEVAYFAQSAVLYQRILGRITPILPRLSATLIEPAIGAMMAQHEVTLPDAVRSTEELLQYLAARALPSEAKHRLADAGNALDEAHHRRARLPRRARPQPRPRRRGLRLQDALPDGPPAPPGRHHRDAARSQLAQTRRSYVAAPLPQRPIAGARAGRGMVPGRVGVRLRQ